MKYKYILTLLIFTSASLAEAQDSWMPRAELPGLPRDAAFGFSIGNYGYVGGGQWDYTLYTNDFWQYNPVTDTWLQKAAFPGGSVYGSMGFSIGNYGYVAGGYTGSLLNTLWQYNPLNNSWTQKASFPGTGRYMAFVFVFGANAYMGTGSINSGTIFLTDVWEYNSIADSWSQKSNFPGTGRSSMVSFTLGGYGYMGTGYAPNVLNDWWQYDPVDDSWSQMGNLPVPRWCGVGFSLGNKGFIGTGYDVSYMNDFYEYDPVTDSWTLKNVFPSYPRFRAAAFVIGNKAYVGTGSTNGNIYLKDLLEYTPDSTVFTVIEQSAQNPEIRMCPNPSEGIIRISAGQPEIYRSSTLSVMTPSGKVIDSRPWYGENIRIDLSGQPKGMYFLKVQSPENVSLKKFVIQ